MIPETILLLTRPENGQTLTVDTTLYAAIADTATIDATTDVTATAEVPKIVLDFSPADAILERDGDNLVFTFDDGSQSILTDFYQQFNADYVPSFEIGGELIAGADFFSAFGDTLMPAAGPATEANLDGSSFNASSSTELLGGVNALGTSVNESRADGFSNNNDIANDITFDNDPIVVADTGTVGTGGTVPADTVPTIDAGNSTFEKIETSEALDTPLSIDFDSKVPENKETGEVLGQSENWGGITISSRKVTFDSDNEITGHSLHGNLGLYNHRVDANDGDLGKGLTVFTEKSDEYLGANGWDAEIGAKPGENAGELVGEGVYFELPKTAYSLDLGLEGFQSHEKWGTETITLIFYKDGVEVATMTRDATSEDGKLFSEDLFFTVPGGFDSVLLAPKETLKNTTGEHNNGGDKTDASSFFINSIEFGGVTTYTGDIAFTGGNIAFDYQDGDTVNSSLGDINIAIATDGSMQGTLEDGTVIFDATLNQNGSWTLKNYEEFKVDGKNFELGFTVSDGSTSEDYNVSIDLPEGNVSDIGRPDYASQREHDVDMGDVITNTETGKTGDNTHTENDDNIAGTEGNDQFKGWDGNDVLYAGGGDDVLYGGGDDDILYGDEGDDILSGNGGSDTLYGGLGNDELYGFASDEDKSTDWYKDELGDERGDVLYGGAGNDKLYGGAGDDVLYGGTGTDTLTGGDDNDTFAWLLSDMEGGTDTITDFTAGDSLAFMDDNGDASTLDALGLTARLGSNNTSIEIFDGSENVQIIEFNDMNTGDLEALLNTINSVS